MDNPGWRYFSPQSDSDRQIDPDDELQLHEGEYISWGNPWENAFYAVTASTLITAHSKQTVEFYFPQVTYGYGRIYMGLMYVDASVAIATEPTFMNQSFRLIKEEEGTGAAFGDTRLEGPITMKWWLTGFPTDGTQWRIFPVCRTDDNETTPGRLIIKIGNGVPLHGLNPGNPPDFEDAVPPAGQDPQNGQLMMKGYPQPATFKLFQNPTPVGPGSGFVNTTFTSFSMTIDFNYYPAERLLLNGVSKTITGSTTSVTWWASDFSPAITLNTAYTWSATDSAGGAITTDQIFTNTSKGVTIVGQTLPFTWDGDLSAAPSIQFTKSCASIHYSIDT